MQLAKKRKEWPKFHLPKERGEITIPDVLNKKEGDLRDEMIHRWCASVWESYRKSHKKIVHLYNEYFERK